MKLATASALILAICGSTSAFSAAPSVNGASTALRATATETYTFTKSEEIFAEAKTVSYVCSSTRRAQYYYFLHAIAFNLLRSVDGGCVVTLFGIIEADGCLQILFKICPTYIPADHVLSNHSIDRNQFLS